MLRKALLVLSGNAATSVLTLLRNLLVARLIPVEDYGIASTLALAVSVIEMASAFGLQQQIVQARDGDDPRLQAALQGFQLMRGVVSSVLLLLLAGPMADFMNTPEAAWGYRAMAILPILSALAHFDVHRLSRGMEFRPMIVAGLVPAVVSLLLAWPVAHWLGDWRAVLVLTLGSAALSVATSHLVARRPYRVAIDRAQIGRSVRFGWPLLVNNVFLFLVFQGDKVIVGRELGMAPLGIFSMGVTLTLTPTLVLTKTAQNLFLPRLSRVDRAAPGGEAEFQTLARAVFEANMAFGAGVAVLVALFGAPFVHYALGPKFADLQPLLVWLAVVQGLRVLKGGPSVVALARASTGNAMVANLIRVGLLPVAFVVAGHTNAILPVVLIALAGELAGFVVSMWLARRVVRTSLRALAWPTALSLLTLAAVLDPLAWLGLGLSPHWSRAAGVLLFAASLASMRDLRAFVLRRGPARA